MRLREREMPLDPEVERELEAIDRAIAGEPVDPDLEPLAELARALSEERVDAEPGFAADLDQRVADGFPRPGQLAGSHRLAELRKKLTAVPPRRILARGRSRGHRAGGRRRDDQPERRDLGWRRRRDLQRAAGARPARGGDAGPAERRGGGQRRCAGARDLQGDGRATGLRSTPGASAACGEAFGFSAAAARRPRRQLQRNAADVPLSKRKVARRVDLALSTSPERFRTAADGVLDVVRDHRGYVLRSSVSGGDPDAPRSRLGHASFTLRIPARELSAALGDLSDLGHVVSRTDGRVDITSRFVSAQKRIAALEETRQNLLRQLAEAVTLTEQESIRRRLEIVEAQLTAAEEDLGAAQRRVQLVPRQRHDRRRPRPQPTATTPVGGASATPSDDAGKVLSVTAGVLLISVAVLGPLAILAALIWLATRALARLRRERALDQI